MADAAESGLNVRITDDHMAVLMDLTAAPEDPQSLLSQIELEMRVLGVSNIPPHEELAERLRRAGKDAEGLLNVVLLEGQPPVPPEDGRIEWTQDFFSAGFAVNEQTGAVDYRQPAAQLAVESGQLLAKVIPPTEGRDGRDVYGRPAAARKPNRALIFAGPNVRVEEKDDGSYFYAQKGGRIRWASNTLAVDEVYHIPRSVGLQTGNIKHPGSVLIEGDVSAGSRVEADGNIEVNGTVEAADLRAGGNLRVHGGITGMGEQAIRVDGGVRAKYVMEADIEAGEDIVVEREILQSKIRTRGALIMRGGRLVGSQATALGGIVLEEAGSKGCVATTLIAAEDYCLDERLAEVRKQISALERTLERIHKKVKPLLPRKSLLSPGQREAMAKLLAAAAEMEKEIPQLSRRLEKIEEDSRARTKPHIYIMKMLHPETTLRIKATSLHITETISGPLRAAPSGKKLVLAPIGGSASQINKAHRPQG